jgi:FtsP/CotA-like multicopper oxidase with cupredoxin domain
MIRMRGASTRLIRRQPRAAALIAAAAVAIAVATLLVASSTGRATSGVSPYTVPSVVDTNPAANVVETTLVAKESTIDIGGGVTAHAQTFNGAVPGPTFHLRVGDTVIVHYKNELAHPSSIHWHGIELSNAMDGTPFTQNQVPPGGQFLYKFKVSRPGIYWYHPHHHSSTNQVFKGLYGMILVDDPNDAALQADGTLPPAAQTKPIVFSDVTVCKAAGSNDTVTYDPGMPWVGGGPLPGQPNPTPDKLCEAPTAIDEDGNARPSFVAGDIPNNQTLATNGRVNEGQTVLTNGMNVGGRAGSPAAPGALSPGASTLDVQAGQGLRLNLLNAATVRYARLRLTTSTGAIVPLVRVGGEGGLLDHAVVEGDDGTPGVFDTGFDTGEILLPPGSRADVVAAIPPSATGVLTLWTEDYNRTGNGFSNIPTVPVMHLNVTGTAPTYTIADGTPLRSATGDPVDVVGAATGTLLDPGTFSPAKLGLASQDIRLTTNGTTSLGINDVFGTHDVAGDYADAPHLGSTRYARVGDTLQLTVTNVTSAHHPFHMHGFSIQPISLTKAANPTYTWPYAEFRDNIDVPAGYSLTFRVKIEDRPLADGTTLGGALGRWVFHCHIFFHAVDGMLGELVVVPSASGNERPNVNTNATSVAVTAGQTATMAGTFSDPDDDAVTLSASSGTVTQHADGTWSWSRATTSAGQSGFVYITATDVAGNKNQTVFSLAVAAAPISPPPPPPPQIIPSPPVPPAVVASFLKSPKTLRVSKSGRFTFSFVATPLRNGKISLKSTKKVKIGSKKQFMTTAAKTFTAPASGKVKVKLKLSSRNRAALKRVKSLRFKVTVKLGGKTFTTKLKLQAPKKT